VRLETGVKILILEILRELAFAAFRILRSKTWQNAPPNDDDY
jgi:hypothetical protein